MDPSSAPADPPRVGLRDIFEAFALIGVSSFGGGLSGWLFREVVERRRWMSSQEFLAGMTVARAMPGANVMNQSIWIGYRLRRTLGAVTAGPLVVIVILALLYRFWAQSPTAHWSLLGVAAGSIGMTLSMGVRALKTGARTPFYGLLVSAITLAVGVLRWPIVLSVADSAPISILWTVFVERADEA